MLGLSCDGTARKPFVQHAVKRSQRGQLHVAITTADFGAARHADALAQSADRDFVALVHQRRLGAQRRLAVHVTHGGGDRVAVHGCQRQLQTHLTQQGVGLYARADNHRVEAQAFLVCCQHLRALAWRQLFDGGVEAVGGPQPLRFSLDQVCKVPAVSQSILRQVDGRVQLGVGVERRFQLAHPLSVNDCMRNTQLFQQCEAPM